MGDQILKRRGLKNTKAQGLLEMALAMIVILLLLAGITQIWNWGNRQIVKRQQRYEASRLIAGTAKDAPQMPGAVDPYKLQWPVYQPEALTEQKVLRGG